MAKKKTAWQQSEFGQIKAVNVFDALYNALSAALSEVGVFMYLGSMPTQKELAIALAPVFVVFFGSIFKGMKTNSKGQPFTKE